MANGCVTPVYQILFYSPQNHNDDLLLIATGVWQRWSVHSLDIIEGTIMGTYCQYRVIELFEPGNGLPRFVEPCRVDRNAPSHVLPTMQKEASMKFDAMFAS